MTIFIQSVFIMFLPSNGASLRRQKGIVSQNTLIYVNKGHNKSLREQYIFITLTFLQKKFN